MSSVMGIAVVGAELRQVPKLGLNFDEVIFAVGSRKLATELRRIGALVPVQEGKVLLFDRAHVEEVWNRFCAGEYAGALEREAR